MAASAAEVLAGGAAGSGVGMAGAGVRLPVLRLGAQGLLAVEEVREDVSTAEEGGARIIGGPRYAPVPPLDSSWSRVTRAAVAHPRARA